MKSAFSQSLPAISEQHLAHILRLWDIRRCYICERIGFCPHRELQVELAELAAAASPLAKHPQPQTRT